MGSKDNFRIVVFAIYSIIFEAIVWGIFGYAVFWQGHSPWWFWPALFVSSCQLKPEAFGINNKTERLE